MSKVEIKHTKKSPEFQREIESLIEALSDGWVGKHDNFAGRIIQVLRHNTTDSRCMVKAGDDESIFVLRAQDATSDKVVDYWCELQIERGLKLVPAQTLSPGDEVKVESAIPPKVADARVCAEEMRHFPRRKSAD